MAGKKNTKNTKKSKKQVEEVKVEKVEKVEEVKEVEKVEKVEEVKVEAVNEFDVLKNGLNELLDKVSTMDDVAVKDLLKFKKELTAQVKSSISQIKKVEKQVSKIKPAEKKKRKVTTSGFDKQVNLVKEALTFITKHCKGQVDDAHPVSRRDVNKYIHTYIKDNNLQNPENRRQIKPNKALQTILSPLSNEKNKNGTTDLEVGYNYFNLQKYIKHIFLKVE
jgi:chromatin remodeling complex protein RSC6